MPASIGERRGTCEVRYRSLALAMIVTLVCSSLSVASPISVCAFPVTDGTAAPLELVGDVTGYGSRYAMDFGMVQLDDKPVSLMFAVRNTSSISHRAIPGVVVTWGVSDERLTVEGSSRWVLRPGETSQPYKVTFIPKTVGDLNDQWARVMIGCTFVPHDGLDRRGERALPSKGVITMQVGGTVVPELTTMILLLVGTLMLNFVPMVRPVPVAVVQRKT